MIDLKAAASDIERYMAPLLDNSQKQQLKAVLEHCLFDPASLSCDDNEPDGAHYLQLFLKAKQLEGCSKRTLGYYESTLQQYISKAGKPIGRITTEDLRGYLADYQNDGVASLVTIDNIRRVLSTFFAWLEDEDHIIKSPMRRIKKIRSPQKVKGAYSDEELEALRDNCTTKRDLAIIDILASTGMRVGELVRLDRADIDFEKRECTVMGKGAKERVVYFDARTKIHLREYLASRTDANPALFVSLLAPHERLQISGVETMLRKLGRSLDIGKVHPHRFRRTVATRAIDRGMPIEQVQVLLGHTKIDTTMRYAMVDQRNVKASHRRYIA